MMDEYRSPPLDAMGVAAQAVRAVLEAAPQSSIREAIGDMETLREAVEQLRDYHEFEPHKINRRRINAQLPYPCPARRRWTVKMQVQVVTTNDEGQESIRELACIEREDLTAEALGLSIADSKALLQSLQEIVVEWQMQTYLDSQRLHLAR